MNRLSWGWVFAAVLGVLVGINWCSGQRNAADRVAAIARADTLQRRADSLTAQHEADSIAAALATARLADSLTAVDRALRSATDQAHRLAAHILADTGAVPRAEVVEALNAKDAVIAQQEVKIQMLTADTAAWRARWLGAAREASSWHQLALDAQQELERANKRSAPRWGCTGGLTGLAGGGLTVSQGQVVAGPTLAGGIGLTCGLHLSGKR